MSATSTINFAFRFKAVYTEQRDTLYTDLYAKLTVVLNDFLQGPLEYSFFQAHLMPFDWLCIYPKYHLPVIQ